MVEINEQIFEIMTKSDINSKLEKRFVQICLGEKHYCFKVLSVREIFIGDMCSSSIMKDRNGYSERASLVKYGNGFLPVIDLRNNCNSVDSYTKGRDIVIVIDAISNGSIIQFGIQMNNLNEIISSIMSEISEDIIFREGRGIADSPLAL